jgi:hypothetical protein
MQIAIRTNLTSPNQKSDRSPTASAAKGAIALFGFVDA